jgi:SAM-dependent methyltransferase
MLENSTLETLSGTGPCPSACPVCGTQGATPRFKVPFPHSHPSFRQGFAIGEHLDIPFWTIAECRYCSLQYACPRPSQSDVARYYADQQEPSDWELKYYLDPDPNKHKGMANLAHAATDLNRGPGRLLEIGCAGGWFLDAARRDGWQVQGLEASPKFQKYAASAFKLPVQLGVIEDLANGNEPGYDAIALFDVLEHLQDPVRDLQTLAQNLKPGGHLLIATCDIGSTCARFYGKDWRQIVISHTVYWTRKSISMAIEKAGMKVTSISEPRYWHPNVLIEGTNKLREILKFTIRIILTLSYVRLSKWTFLRELPARLISKKFTYEYLFYKIGDQPVLNDVMLVVARKPLAD